MNIFKAVNFAVLDGATRQIVITFPEISGPIVRIEPSNDEEGTAEVTTEGDIFFVTVERVKRP